MNRKLRVLVVGVGFGLVHQVVEWSAWMQADRALLSGQVRTIAKLWRVVSFPAFPLYEWLSGGDRAMFQTFHWVMIGNSIVWGTMAALVFAVGSSTRAATKPKP